MDHTVKPRSPRSRHKKRESGMRSGFEEKVGASLTSSEVPYEYEKHVLNYVTPPVPAKLHRYTPDFFIPRSGGGKLIIEAKGQFDKADRDKMLLVIEQNPDLDIRLLFERDNPIRKGSPTRYSTWCIKNGIKYAVSAKGHIPSEWIE